MAALLGIRTLIGDHARDGALPGLDVLPAVNGGDSSGAAHAALRGASAATRGWSRPEGGLRWAQRGVICMWRTALTAAAGPGRFWLPDGGADEPVPGDEGCQLIFVHLAGAL